VYEKGYWKMKIQLVSREYKYFFGWLTRKEYAIKRGDKYKDMKHREYNKDKFWWRDSSEYFEDCFTTNYRKAKNIFNFLNSEPKEFYYYIVEEGDIK
jgi:hypothetical protein